MMRVRATQRLQTLASQRRAASSLVPSFTEVKFQKEDVNKVMAELPDFNFYEMNESVPNPYNGTFMDRSILLDTPPTPVITPPKTEFSKLENGLKIASVDKQGLTARLGLFVSAGSRFENSSNFGVSDMVSMMGFTSTAHLSHLRTVKTLEQLGSNLTSTCKAGKEEMVYSVDVAREFVPLTVPLMVGNVLFPRLLPWEVKSAHKKVKEGQADLAGDGTAMVQELLNKAAFCNNSLGFSAHATERSLSYFTPETMRSFMLDHFAPERMVLVGVNVSHTELSKWAMRSFADYNAIPLKKRDETKASYTGGEMRLEGPATCHVAIGLQGASWGSEELAAATVLRAVLGASGSNPGSGLTTRLATQVMSQNAYVDSVTAFNTAYTDSGLFGVYGQCKPDKAGDFCKAICKSLSGLTTISKDELAKAKAMLKGQLLRELDDDSVLMKEMGMQLLHTGKYASPADLAKAVDAVTEASAIAVAKKMLSSPPTVAAYGDVHTVPHYSAICDALKA